MEIFLSPKAKMKIISPDKILNSHVVVCNSKYTKLFVLFAYINRDELEKMQGGW